MENLEHERSISLEFEYDNISEDTNEYESNAYESRLSVLNILLSIVSSIEKRFSQKEVLKREKRKDSQLFSPIVKRKKAATLLPKNMTATDVTLESLDEVILVLNNFELQAKVFAIQQVESMLPYDIPPVLEGYLEFVAKCGYTYFPWSKIKLLFEMKLNNVLIELSSTLPMTQFPFKTPNLEMFNFDNAKARMFQKLESYNGVPFTIQRIAELLTSHKHYYKTTEKYMVALEKVMLVVSTMEVSPYVEQKLKSPLVLSHQLIAPPSSPLESNIEMNPLLELEGKSVIETIIVESVVKLEPTTEGGISTNVSYAEKLHSDEQEASNEACKAEPIEACNAETMEVDPECTEVQNPVVIQNI